MQLSKTKRIVSWKYEELLYKNMRNIEDTKNIVQNSHSKCKQFTKGMYI